MTQIIKKLSIKGILGTLDVPEEGETKVICRLMGIAKGAKTVTTTFGESTALLGDFAGINTETNEVFRAPVMYAPAILIDMLLPQVEQGNSIEFAFDVTVTGDKTVAVKYRYGLQTVIAPAQDDPMLKLMEKVAQAALSAPVIEPLHPVASGKKGTK
jgi:hypothetical protein